MKSKLFLLAGISILLNWSAMAQIASDKTTFKFNNTPDLKIENIVFADENGDKKADPNEKCLLSLTVKNYGKSVAESVILNVNTSNSDRPNFTFQESFTLGNIRSGESKDIKIQIAAASGFENDKEMFQFIARESRKYDSKLSEYIVPLKTADNENTLNEAIAINWYYPFTINTKVNNSRYSLKGCVVSDEPVDKVELTLNNKPFGKDIRVFKSVNCDNYFEQVIDLAKGNNLVKITAKNSMATVESEIRNIVFEDFKLQNRYALIIGNSDYMSAPLRNPVNDANLMSEELTKLGFEVISIKNGSQNQMKAAISKFGDLLSKDKNTVGLFYYAGHGIQIKGKNYLVPTDAKISKEPDVEVYCVDLDGLLANLEYSGNNMNIIILDACRNNPFGRSFRSGAGPGLATVNAPVGTIIAYATSPGSVAADGTGENGLYTEQFVKALEVPNIKIEDVFKKVRTQVKNLSEGRQIPWENSSIEGDFYFVKY